ncbi:hypothetical protein CKAH01_04530 [Colletotrichum kahawae]|uniref:Uncharacterized protein n=1 Tax=Colletotrichum kahawae TaxID=34407 RepID=A0AAD9YKD9_COLKA|nr:hypothetical protein CKAH01_04530 [Colletotrichum kahawae]
MLSFPMPVFLFSSVSGQFVFPRFSLRETEANLVFGLCLRTCVHTHVQLTLHSYCCCSEEEAISGRPPLTFSCMVS